MKFLLTSGGVTNPSIRAALTGLLGKPIAESSALCIPTAQWGHPMCGPASARGFVVGEPPHHMTGLGWKSVGLLELTALPTIGEERWIPWIREADALLVGFHKKGAGRPSMTRPESVDKALCSGGIDGVRKGVDADR